MEKAFPFGWKGFRRSSAATTQTQKGRRKVAFPPAKVFRVRSFEGSELVVHARAEDRGVVVDLSGHGDARERIAEAAFPMLLNLLLPRSAYRYSPLIVMLLVTAYSTPPPITQPTRAGAGVAAPERAGRVVEGAEL